MKRIIERARHSTRIFLRDLDPLVSFWVARFIVWRVLRREAQR